MWMFIEGFQLYRLAINVFDVWNRKWTLFYIIIAYNIPFVIVGITVLVANSLEPIVEDDTTKSGIVQVYSGDET